VKIPFCFNDLLYTYFLFSDIRVLPEQQARDKSKEKRKNLFLLKVHGDKENADIIKN
jgi:hypothetical protein